MFVSPPEQAYRCVWGRPKYIAAECNHTSCMEYSGCPSAHAGGILSIGTRSRDRKGYRPHRPHYPSPPPLQAGRPPHIGTITESGNGRNGGLHHNLSLMVVGSKQTPTTTSGTMRRPQFISQFLHPACSDSGSMSAVN